MICYAPLSMTSTYQCQAFQITLYPFCYSMRPHNQTIAQKSRILEKNSPCFFSEDAENYQLSSTKSMSKDINL